MPPKARISKEQIIDKAVDLIRKEKTLTASTLSKELKCSTQPIFWYFNNMEEVKSETLKQAHKNFSDFLRVPIEGISSYKSTGIRYIQFARNEKGLFKLLFMSERSKDENIFVDDSNIHFLTNLICKTEFVDKSKADEIYKIMWLFCHGIATMIATKNVEINDSEVEYMLETVCKGIIGGNRNETIIKR